MAQMTRSEIVLFSSLGAVFLVTVAALSAWIVYLQRPTLARIYDTYLDSEYPEYDETDPASLRYWAEFLEDGLHRFPDSDPNLVLDIRILIANLYDKGKFPQRAMAAFENVATAAALYDDAYFVMWARWHLAVPYGQRAPDRTTATERYTQSLLALSPEEAALFHGAGDDGLYEAAVNLQYIYDQEDGAVIGDADDALVVAALTRGLEYSDLLLEDSDAREMEVERADLLMQRAGLLARRGAALREGPEVHPDSAAAGRLYIEVANTESHGYNRTDLLGHGYNQVYTDESRAFIEHMEPMLADAERDASYYYWAVEVGEAYHVLGDFEEAEVWLEACVTDGPDDGSDTVDEAHFSLAELYADTKRPWAATGLLLTLFEEFPGSDYREDGEALFGELWPAKAYGWYPETLALLEIDASPTR